MEWLRDSAMLLRLTTIRYFLSRKEQEPTVFVKEGFLHWKIQKKEDVFGHLTTKSLRKVLRYCEIVWSTQACEDYKLIEKFDKICSYYLERILLRW